MKKALTLVALALGWGLVSAHAGQDESLTKLKKLDFLIGHWSGNERLYDVAGGEPGITTGNLDVEVALHGRYLRGTHTFGLALIEVEESYMISYDGQTKQFKAYLFDASNPKPLELSGNFEGDKLVMESKPALLLGMSKPTTFRAIWEKKSSSEMDFGLEMDELGKWQKVIIGTFTKQ